MKIINSSHTLDFPGVQPSKEEVYKFIERIGRICYKSEDKITEESAPKFIKMLQKRRHYGMFEHFHVTVKGVVSRGMSHEMVRHRIATYAQESTRYVTYTKSGFTVIRPEWMNPRLLGEIEEIDLSLATEAETILIEQILMAEEAYSGLRGCGLSPQQARYVIPDCMKTEIVSTLNLSAWTNFFQKRVDPAALPEIQKYAGEVLETFKEWLPELFSGLIPYSLQEVVRKGGMYE